MHRAPEADTRVLQKDVGQEELGARPFLKATVNIPLLSTITWSPSLSTGMDTVDDHHKRLFALCGALAGSFAHGVSSKDLRGILDELEACTRPQFLEEQALMERWPVDPDHKLMHLAAHRSFTTFLGRARALAASEPADTIADTLFFLAQWLLHHALEVDRRMVGQICAAQSGQAVVNEGAPQNVRDMLMTAVTQLADALGERTYNFSRQRRRLTDLQNLYRALVVSADVLIQGDREHEMLQNLCDELSRTVFHTAWIGRPGADGLFEVLAIAGSGAMQIEEARPRLTQDRNASLVVQVWRCGVAAACNDTLAESSLAPWHATFARNGWRSLIALPVMRAGELWAVLALASPRRHTFDEQTVDLCHRIVSLLSYGLDELDVKTRIQDMQAEESRSARTDALTGLPNRRALDERMEQAFADSDGRRKLAVVMIDLDGFKLINDAYGHGAGDAILTVIADRLRTSLRQGDFVARWGGDEFVVLLDNCSCNDDVAAVLKKLGDIVREPVEIAGIPPARLDLSAGVCIEAPGRVAHPDILVRHADRALYESKERRKDRLRFWACHGEPLPTRLNRAQTLVRDDDFVTLYQPIFDRRLATVARVEAFPHFRDGFGGHLAPAQFLQDLNGDDLRHLAWRVLHQCLDDRKRLKALGLSVAMSVNVDATTVDHELVMFFREACAEGSTGAMWLTLEIQHGGDLLKRDDTHDLLRDLRAMGVRLSLDDVGSLYSSLLCLKDLPIDEIKLDQAFVRTIEEHPEGIVFTAAMRDLALNLGVDMVAEGVETEDIRDVVSVLDVPLLQGYALAVPMSFKDLAVVLGKRGIADSRRPMSLLGVYARHREYDQGVRRHIRGWPLLPMRPESLGVGTCPISADLERLGFASRHDLQALHARYHESLGRIGQGLSGGSRARIDDAGWQAVDKAHQAFLGAILAVYREPGRMPRTKGA
ncbi:diguanylate cyclase [Acidiferrobacter sp.]|uniref:diguanylate cyclase domain-containing protein n=1 Tax=Acidiferrobacter sp. TaxID=1872107 RepID=UPI00262B131A|nr:diguanylate cyclase [Acidiferrobacter sp.]